MDTLKARSKLKLSQDGYAKLIGSTQSAVSKWERDAVTLPQPIQRLNRLLWHDPSLAAFLIQAFPRKRKLDRRFAKNR